MAPDAQPAEPGATARRAIHRRYPIGAEATDAGVHVRVWAPDRQRLAVVVADGSERLPPVPLDAEGDGYFSGLIAGAAAGSRYWLKLDDDDALAADPASRFQPQGPLGPSQVVDPMRFAWTDADWRGLALEGQVVYEMHIGAFTPEGTWRAAIDHLPKLAETGITVLEIMPIADFSGDFGWGYDGVSLFAPTRLYGGPDDARAFIDAAHGLGLAVILDVVYNHLGPVGNVLPRFAAAYFTDRYRTDWGQPLNFDGPDSAPVRDFYTANARYWIDEFHFDGLRIDATQNIYDAGQGRPHILAAITHAARAAAANRRVIVIAENEPQDVRLLRPFATGGFGMDGMWNDDLHHAAIVALTGRKEAYYTDYHGNPQEFVSAARYAFLYQGQRYKWQKAPRGTLTFGMPRWHFVNFLQNHDQIANSGLGERIHKLTSPGRLRAMTAYMLLIPGTPMLFMGQEFAASQRFLYFADQPGELADLVDAGRKEFLGQFRSLATPEIQEQMPHPADPATFAACKLDWAERDGHGELVRLHTDLLRLRRADPAFCRQAAPEGAVLGPGCFVLRFFGADDGGVPCPGGDDRLLLVNLEADLHLDPAPEPLLAPPAGCTWEVLWSSEDPGYGGSGTPAIYSDDNWWLPGQASLVMRPVALPPEEGAAAADR